MTTIVLGVLVILLYLGLLIWTSQKAKDIQSPKQKGHITLCLGKRERNGLQRSVYASFEIPDELRKKFRLDRNDMIFIKRAT